MGDCFASQIVKKYVEQESEERTEIHFAPNNEIPWQLNFIKRIKCALL